MTARQLWGGLLGLLAGLAVLTAALAIAYVFSQRLWTDSLIALAIFGVIFGVAGAFAGWLVGVLVYSAIRASSE
jgi:hypothetical protein